MAFVKVNYTTRGKDDGGDLDRILDECELSRSYVFEEHERYHYVIGDVTYPMAEKLVAHFNRCPGFCAKKTIQF
jgi:hypothetical protein